MKAIPGASERGTAADTFRRLYWDTAISWSDPILEMLRAIVGIDRVLYGSDYPYLQRDLAVGSVRALEQTKVLNDSERQSIFNGTATKAYPAVSNVVAAVA